MKNILILMILFVLITGVSNSTLKAEKKSGFAIEVKKISPFTKGSLKLKEKIFAWFSYKVPENYNEGVYIWLIPKSRKFTASFTSSGRSVFIFQPSPLIFSKAGTITRFFSINRGNVRIRKIWVRMMDRNQTRILAQEAVKVNFLSHPETSSFKNRKKSY